MVLSRISVATLGSVIIWLHFGLVAHAADLTGAWATNAAACKKIFVKMNDIISIAPDSDLYGSGFIIDGNRIRGKITTCNITSRKEDGAMTHLIAVCSTDVSLSTIQFSLKLDDENKITRVFPGVPELATQYFRCSF